jgi:hypothetical protein
MADMSFVLIRFHFCHMVIVTVLREITAVCRHLNCNCKITALARFLLV